MALLGNPRGTKDVDVEIALAGGGGSGSGGGGIEKVWAAFKNDPEFMVFESEGTSPDGVSSSPRYSISILLRLLFSWGTFPVLALISSASSCPLTYFAVLDLISFV